MPFFSIIIPTYNRAHCLLSAVQSVLCQTCTDFELIIVDDGSTDGTTALLGTLTDPRLILVRQANHGVAIARNAGIARSQAGWITFLDSDDEVVPDWLLAFADMIRVQPESGIIFCGVTQVSTETGQTKIVMPREMGAIFRNQIGLFLSGAFVVRKDLLLIAGGYDEQLTYSENYELGIRLIEACVRENRHVFQIYEPNLIYRQARKNKNSHLLQQKIFKSCILIINKHEEVFLKSKRKFSQFCRIIGVNAYKCGEKGLSRKYFKKAFILHPLDVKALLSCIVVHLGGVASLVWKR